MIKFENIRWKNFLSTGNNWNSINFADYKTNLIVGGNGEGKSTLLDGITFVLFNKPFRKINLPQLVNTTNNSDLLVEIKFSSGNKDYKVIRGIKPKVFEIWEDGAMLQQNAAIKDCQEYLENHILKMNYKAFTQIVLIGSATHQPFMKLSPSDRRNVVETFLDIDIFTKMNGLLKNRIGETKELINDVSYRFDLSKEKIKMAQSILSNSEESIDAKIEETLKEIDKTIITIGVKQDQINALNSEISSIIFNTEEVLRTKEKISKIHEYLTTFKTKHKSTSKEIDFLESNDSCSTCKQEIDSSFKKKSLLEKKESLKKLEEGITTAEDKLEGLNSFLNSHLENMEEIKERNTRIERINIDINYLSKERDKLEEEIKKLEKEKKKNLEKNREEYESLLAENSKLSDERDSLLSDQHLNSIAAVLLKDDGIKTKIIRHYLPIMNKLINKYLQQLDFYVNYTLDENFEEKIKQASKEGFSYNSFSEGEKLRVDLAILFAWREIAKGKNSTNTNLLILDETFDSSLDNSGIDDFMGIINTISEETHVFIISHKGDVIQDKFTNVIKFQKINGFSKIM